MNRSNTPSGIPALFVRLTRYAAGPYAAFNLAIIFFLVSRAVPGLIVQRVLDILTGDAPASPGILGLVAIMVGVQAARVVSQPLSSLIDANFRYQLMARLRKNILTSIYERPGAAKQPTTPGDALDRFNHDVAEVGDFPTWIPYVVGNGIFALIAFAIMVQINAAITLVVVVPLLGVVALTNLVRDRLLHFYTQSRQADSRVTSFLGEIFAAVQAVKVAGAERGVIDHMAGLNEKRRRANVRRRLMVEMLHWAFHHISDLGVGAMLLMSGGLIESGTFTVGDFALFTTYIWFLVRFPSTAGEFIADYKTQAVSIERMLELQAAASVDQLTAPGPVYLDGTFPTAAVQTVQPEDRLESLRVEGLSYRHPDNGGGIEAIGFELQAGTLTVITGEIGSGKTTLLRVLLGLLPADSGTVFWNGQAVADPAAFFVPPRSAYTPQVPRLFSQTLRDNILLGLPAAPEALQFALEAAVLEADVAVLEHGLDTVVGPRGVRLSGGQIQRAAAARMLVRSPELLVIDDVSSALDAETEHTLWERLFDQPEGRRQTALVVSHRKPLLRRADQVMVLSGGRLET